MRYIERRDGKWLVHFQPLDEGREKFSAPDLFVTADIVMLGAGTLGSTEILLRSKAQGLPLSDAVGERFTGNGDVLGFSYNGGRDGQRHRLWPPQARRNSAGGPVHHWRHRHSQSARA